MGMRTASYSSSRFSEDLPGAPLVRERRAGEVDERRLTVKQNGMTQPYRTLILAPQSEVAEHTDCGVIQTELVFRHVSEPQAS